MIGLDSVTAALLIGGALGAAVWLFVIAVQPPRTDLRAAAARWDNRRHHYPAPGEITRVSLPDQIGARITREARKRGYHFTKLRHNLALLDRSIESHMFTKLAMALVGLLLPTTLSTVLGIQLLPATLGGLLLAVAFWFAPDQTVADQAARRRSDLRRALACYLDLVSMSLAGGRGLPEALPSAAAVGQGWGFELLANTVETARRSGVTPWTAFADLGERTGVSELQDLGNALSLVVNDGARVRESLSARAASQRSRQLAESEGAVKKAHQGISKAQMVMVMGFFVFIGYPALVRILAF